MFFQRTLRKLQVFCNNGVLNVDDFLGFSEMQTSFGIYENNVVDFLPEHEKLVPLDQVPKSVLSTRRIEVRVIQTSKGSFYFSFTSFVFFPWFIHSSWDCAIKISRPMFDHNLTRSHIFRISLVQILYNLPNIFFSHHISV